jgi:hypothetical protein
MKLGISDSIRSLSLCPVRSCLFFRQFLRSSSGKVLLCGFILIGLCGDFRRSSSVLSSFLRVVWFPTLTPLCCQEKVCFIFNLFHRCSHPPFRRAKEERRNFSGDVRIKNKNSKASPLSKLVKASPTQDEIICTYSSITGLKSSASKPSECDPSGSHDAMANKQIQVQVVPLPSCRLGMQRKRGYRVPLQGGALRKSTR